MLKTISKIFGAYTPQSVVPLPPELTALPTIKAEPWFQVDSSPEPSLEGPAFDRDNNLFFTNHEAILRITPQKQISTVFTGKNIIINSLAFHNNGTLYAVCLTGELLSMKPDGSDVKYMYPKFRGKLLRMNDLVFDTKGNIYVTDFTGTPVDPTGGVYRLSPDASIVEPVCQNLAAPNGISLSPDGDVLWIAETTRNAIVRLRLMEDGITLSPIDGVNYPYYSTGCPGGPDSSKVDVAGNLYQCIIFQGRAIILNEHGIPVTNVIIPERDEGRYLRTTNLAFKPGTSEAHITLSGEGGAWIFRFTGLAEGLKLYSHQLR